MRRKVDFNIVPDRKTAKELLLMGIRQSWADLAVLLNGQISLLVIRYVLDDFEQVGYFSRGQRIALLVITRQAVLPMLFSGGRRSSRTNWPPMSSGAAVLFCPGGVYGGGSADFGKWILLILYGREFFAGSKADADFDAGDGAVSDQS